MRFAEEILPFQDLAYSAKCGELGFVIVSLILISGLINEDNRSIGLIYKCLSVLSICILAASWIHPHWLVLDYTFSSFRFGNLYLWIAAVWFVWSTAIAVISKQRPGYFVFFIIPLGVHLTGALSAGSPGNLLLLILYPLWLVSIQILSADFKAFRIGGQVFANITNLIQDSVLICDADNNIIYRNSHAREAGYLSKSAVSVPGGNPDTVFSNTMTRCCKYDFDTYVSDTGDRHMDCGIKDIRQGKNLVGRALVISDITNLISMLDLQVEQKNKLEEVNQKLDQYSKIVFDLVKEKEVSSLISGITQTQEQVMASFRQRIKSLSTISSPTRFDSQVDSLIKEARTNLAEIRDIVARYRKYYGTEN